MKHKQFQLGDRVAYARAFLNNTMNYSKDAAERRGTVIYVSPGISPTIGGYLRIVWDHEAPTARTSLAVNIVKESRLHLEAV